MPEAVTITVRYFAALRERASRSSEQLALPAGATAADALAALAARHPALLAALAQTRSVASSSAVGGGVVGRAAGRARAKPVRSATSAGATPRCSERRRMTAVAESKSKTQRGVRQSAP
ncbi:MAG: MoaD/ThiS family protein [Chloroflexi bacterium]|nr:MoaD/ThiS family protein [Chloroflexota bacterium]